LSCTLLDNHFWICYYVIVPDNDNENSERGPFVNPNKRPTIKQVAKATGVSTQTVSRVINERPDVAPATRERILTAIDELGYQPSALARSLIQQRSYTLGVVTAGLKHIGPSRTLNGITSAAEEAGYALLLKELPRFDAENVLPIFQALLAHHVDGIIWAVPEVGENRNWVDRQSFHLKVPVVHLAMEPKQNISIVSVDNYLGARMAISHLLEQGYRHIGHISGPMDWWEARQRAEAWEDGLRAFGLAVRDEHCVEGNWSSASGARAFGRLFEQYPEMDSIFVGNDQMALGVIQIACEKGLQIPEDLGIVGFDNIPESAFFCPALTTIEQDQYALGKVAVEETIKMIKSGWHGLEPVESKAIMLTPTLLMRHSSARSSNQ
jgi:DNA-binding LacI/PurR family transcriptional regulator